MSIDDIKKRLEMRKHAKTLCNWIMPPVDGGFELGASEDADIEYLLAENERLTKVISEFVDKHFHGGSKANRSDYVGLGIPTADIHKLREAIRAK